MALDVFSALQFISPAPVALAEIQEQFSITFFALSLSDKSFHTLPFK